MEKTGCRVLLRKDIFSVQCEAIDWEATENADIVKKNKSREYQKISISLYNDKIFNYRIYYKNNKRADIIQTLFGQTSDSHNSGIIVLAISYSDDLFEYPILDDVKLCSKSGELKKTLSFYLDKF